MSTLYVLEYLALSWAVVNALSIKLGCCECIEPLMKFPKVGSETSRTEKRLEKGAVAVNLLIKMCLDLN
jgi:hypothetical protein